MLQISAALIRITRCYFDLWILTAPHQMTTHLEQKDITDPLHIHQLQKKPFSHHHLSLDITARFIFVFFTEETA